MADGSWRLLRWLGALLYLLLCFLPLLFTPLWLTPWLTIAIILTVVWNFVTWETAASRMLELRPLTPWDVKEYAEFRQRLSQGCQELGLDREPVLAVVEDRKNANAMAVAGRRGLIIFTTRMLRTCTTEQLLWVAGHELKHIAARDSLPAMVGGVALRIVGGLIRVLLLLPLLNLLILPVSWAFNLIAFTAATIVAKRSRMEEQMADLVGARLTSAAVAIETLTRLEAEHIEMWGDRRAPAWSPLWVAQRLHAKHPPTAERVRFLQQAVERGTLHAG